MVIDCKQISQRLKEIIRDTIDEKELCLKLSIVKVGYDPASEAYVKGKVKDCEEVGITTEVFQFPETVEESRLIRLIRDYQKHSDGIIVQLPLPKHIHKEKVIQAIDRAKDVDGFRKDSPFIPCTPAGIMRLLPDDLSGKDCLIINRSDIVGRPLVNLLLDRNATVTIAHSKTRDLESKIKQADVVVTAVGIPNFIKLDMLNSTQTIIDVSINRGEDDKLRGDLEKPYGEVDFAYTPVPNGIGLMTRAMLLYNVLSTAVDSRELDKIFREGKYEHTK